MSDFNTPKKLLTSVCTVFSVEVNEIKSKSRVRELSDARKAIVTLLREYFNMSTKEISRYINKNPCTTNYMLKESESLIKFDHKYKVKLDRVKALIGMGSPSCPCCGRPYDKSQ